MSTYSHLATCRYLQAQGNSALYVRLRDGAGLYYNFTSGTWDAVESADSKQFLAEVDDASAVESRYQATVALPEINATTILEYVRVADALVIAEEGLPARSAVTTGPTGGTTLTSVANVKAYLGSAKSTDDALLARIVVAASKWFESQIGRSLTLQSHSDAFVGEGNCVAITQEYPLNSVTSITVDGNLIPVDGYFIAGNAIYLKGYYFTKGTLVQVAYTAGYSEIPADVEQAVIEVTADRYNARTRVGQVSQTVNGETSSFVQFTIPVSVLSVINTYRKHNA
jgi:hypothetical protein